jgi:hypothetical protein
MAIIQKFKNWLSEPTDGHVLGLFRLVYGLFMIYNTYYYYEIKLIEKGLLAPKVLFKYDGLEWLHPLPAPMMYAILVTMGLAATLIAAGVLFRWACWIFAICLSFFFFQEKGYYNNHIYLFILLPPLLSATHADHFLSLRGKIDPLWRREGGGKIPRWEQFIIQAQFVIVYFYGGIVKMKADWLVRKEPVTSLVGYLPDGHWLAPLLRTDFSISLLTYGGFLLDILAPLLLWQKGIRRWAIIPFVGFHLANSRIFTDIGIFPYVMLGALIIFYETNELPWLRRLAERRRPAADKSKKQKQKSQPSESLKFSENLPPTPVWVKNTLIGYFIFQLLFPFRGFFLPNQLDYTTIGNRFSWRMKADTRLAEEVKFFIQDPVSKQEAQVDIRSFINDMQMNALIHDPRAVADFARMLKKEAARQGLPNAMVRASIRLRYNGRPAQYFVKPDVDLASVTYSPFRKLDWVVPVPE